MNAPGPGSPRRLLVTAVALGLGVLFIYRVAELLLLLFLAVLFSIYLSALTDAFQKRLHLPRTIGIGASLLVTLVSFGGLGLLLVPQLTRQGSELMIALPHQMLRWEESITVLLQRYPLLQDLVGPVKEGQSYFGTVFGEIGQYFTDAFPYLFGGFWFLVHVISVVAMSLYLAANPSAYRAEVVQLVPPRSREFALDILCELGDTMRAWIGGQLLAMVVLGILMWGGLAVLGVPYALAFGAFTGLVAIVPFFGTLFSTLLPAMYVFPNDGALFALAVIGWGVIVHLVEANVVAPKIFERQVELPPVWTLLSVLVGLKLLGAIGLIVAVPLLAAGRVLVRRIYIDRMLEGGAFRPLAGDEPITISVAGNEDLRLIDPDGPSVPEAMETSPV